MVRKKDPKEMTLVEILEDAIHRENDAYDYYTNAASAAVDPSAKKMFLSLAEREKEHVMEICDMLTQIRAQMEVDRAITGGANPLC